MLRKLTVTLKIEAQAGDDSPLAPLLVEALQEFIAATNENSANAGKFESKAGLDVTWSARNEYFDDLGNQVHIADTGVAEAVGVALLRPHEHAQFRSCPKGGEHIWKGGQVGNEYTHSIAPVCSKCGQPPIAGIAVRTKEVRA